jgi:hypothetical protein
VLVSEESADYRPEMEWLVKQLGASFTVADAEEYQTDGGAVYRFFEMFDWESIPAARPMADAAASGKLRVTPPFKPHLEDKLWLAFDEVFWDPDVDVINWIDPVNPGHWPFWVNGYKIIGEPILVGFDGGAVARAFAQMSDDEVVASAMAAVRGMTE